jgi:gamma-glutamyltranspeptidase/glutathione hydrolase
MVLRGTWSRRDVLTAASGGLIAVGTGGDAAEPEHGPEFGKVVGQREAALAGNAVLRDGGNAADAIGAAALVAAVVAVSSCGIGGYGGHAVICSADGKKVSALDFNSTAPASARPDMFDAAADGTVAGRVNALGWLAAGVPGTLAGIQMLLDRFGTWSFRRAVQPAIQHARTGITITAAQEKAWGNLKKTLARDPACAALFFPGGDVPPAGTRLPNPELAVLLATLAERDSVASFYDGDLAGCIADAFAERGGLVTRADLAAYRAREVTPLRLTWRGYEVVTAPLTAGGATILQTLATLRELGWEKLPIGEPATAHARLEALRLAWLDRMARMGDPEALPADRRAELAGLLSVEYARAAAETVRSAVRDRRPVPGMSDGFKFGGTVHLSAVDRSGMMAALTLTHGGAFGAQVAVPGLGLVLGHGMSRFDPRPGRPNSPGAGKRPLNNMCPAVLLKGGQPVAAIGAAGGRRIVNSVFEVLLQMMARDLPLAAALAAPRVHTEGDWEIILDAHTDTADETYYLQMGYRLKRGAMANVSAVGRR